jgi:DNA-binding NtrC family response regulator
MSVSKHDPRPPGTAEPVTRRRVLLIADLTPRWAETVSALQQDREAAEFDLIAPGEATPALSARLKQDASEAAVVIVDLASDPMRGMSTVAACRHLAPDVPVVVVAANPSQELARRIRLSGVFYLALDPIAPDEMHTILQSAFGCVARRQSRTSACRDKQRILLIDDDADYLASTTALLQSQGYSVSTARSGKEGMARLAQDAPDLVVLDIVMEDDWAGYAVNQQIKFGDGLECIRHVPILMVSSIPVDPTTRFSRAGEVDMVTPDAYMTKPVDVVTFLAVVRKLLGEPETAPVG